jgi:hypothetical protein
MNQFKKGTLRTYSTCINRNFLLENNPISIHPCVYPCRSNNTENDDTNNDDALAVNPILKRQDLKMTAAPIALEAQSATPIM